MAKCQAEVVEKSTKKLKIANTQYNDKNKKDYIYPITKQKKFLLLQSGIPSHTGHTSSIKNYMPLAPPQSARRLIVRVAVTNLNRNDHQKTHQTLHSYE